MSEPQYQNTLVHLTKNRPLAQIWLASNLNNLNRSIMKTNIVESVEEITKVAINNGVLEPITLHASGELLHGVVRVYSQKTSFLLTDITDLLHKMKSVFRGNTQKSTTVQVDTIAKLDQLILTDAVTEMDVLVTPSLEFLDESNLPTSFMGGEQLMDRHVQGAISTAFSPWDMSLEVGRRFAPDDELEQDHSELDLNFEINDSHSKSWGEGTNNSDRSLNNNHLPISPQNENLDWDLSINEEHKKIDDPDVSIELGRKALQDDTFHETLDFGFDLGIDKADGDNILEDQSIILQEINDVQSETKKTFIGITNIVVDENTELSNQATDESPSTINTRNHLNIKKRTWSDVISGMEFLPPNVTELFFPYAKKQKNLKHHTPETLHSDTEDAHFDISLGLDETLIHSSDVENNINSISHSPIDTHDGYSNENSSSQNDIAISLHENSFLENITSSPIKQSRQTELDTGELISKYTKDIAEALKLGYDEDSVIQFDDILKRIHGDKVNKVQASKTFFEILSMATTDYIELEQETTFGPICIIGKPLLHEKLMSAL